MLPGPPDDPDALQLAGPPARRDARRGEWTGSAVQRGRGSPLSIARRPLGEPVEPACHGPSVFGFGFFFLDGLALAVAVSPGLSSGFAGSALGGAGAGGTIFL
jgi:hypothetical protein